MHIILTGATGLVGSAVLDAMIKMKDITKISILSRRPVKMADDAKDPRINVIIHHDFERYEPELLDQLRDATGCVWALGISQNAVGKEEYVKITKTYTLAAAEAFGSFRREGGSGDRQPFHFVYVSGEGTTLTPGRFTPMYARVKGETELELARMQETPLLRTVSVRPAAVDEAGHAAIAPYLPAKSAAYVTAGAVMMPVIRMAAKGWHSPTAPLGKFLAEMAMGKWQDGSFVGRGFEKVGGSGFTIVGNAGFRRLAGLDKA